jgi:chemotaxis signal transduction protein
LETERVREVLEADGVQDMPPGYFPFVGLLNLRNIPIPVFDLSAHLEGDFRSGEAHQGRRIIVCDMREHYLGILVDKTFRVDVFSSENVHVAPLQATQLKGTPLKGVILEENRFVYLLDFDQILESLNSSRFQAS